MKPGDDGLFLDGLPDTEYVAGIFKAMADETRLRILYLLSRKEWGVQELASILNSSASNVSHHLRLLRVMRLVKHRKKGRRVLYSLDDEHVKNLILDAFAHGMHE